MAAALGADEMTLEMLTREGVVPGTLPYMSPEQVRGEVLDQRSTSSPWTRGCTR